jgi:hypothetical protein
VIFLKHSIGFAIPDFYIHYAKIGKEFDITIKIINNIVYVYKEQERPNTDPWGTPASIPSHPDENPSKTTLTDVNAHYHLGLDLQSNCKWGDYVSKIYKKACDRLKILRMLDKSVESIFAACI